MAHLLTAEEFDDFFANHQGWVAEDDKIQKTFEFRDFNEAYGFVSRIALQSERMYHHPDIEISWNKVSIMLSTHSEGGVTNLDLELAAFCDDAF